MPRLPDVTALGARPEIDTRMPIPNQESGVIERATAQAAGQTAAAAQDLTQIGQQFGAMEQRIRTRADAVGRAQAFSEFNELAQGELRRLTTEADLSDMNVANGYNKFLAEKMTDVLSRHGGSAESRLALQERLDTVRGSLLGQAGMMGAEIGEKKVITMLGNNLSTINNAVQDDPSKIGDMIRVLDADIDDMAPALTPEKEIELRSIGRKELAKTALNSYLARGAFGEAQTLLRETPGLVQMLSPDEQRIIGSRFAEAERAASEARNAGIRKRQELAAILGREPTMVELTRHAGVAAPTGEKTASDKIRDIETALGRPLSAAEKSKALGVYQGALTPAGKLVEDRISFVGQYGEGSPEVAAFDAATVPAPDMDKTNGLRGELIKQSGDFVKVRDSFSKIAAAAPTPAGDLSLIFAYMKMLDPGSTVREGEAATATNAASIPERIRAQYNKAVTGEALTDPIRADFKNQAQSLLRAAINKQVQLEDEYRGIAQRNKLPEADVVIDLVKEYRQFAGEAPPAPDAAGKVRIRVDGAGRIIGTPPPSPAPAAPKNPTIMDRNPGKAP